MSGGFLWGAGGSQLTPEEIAVQRALFAKKRLQGVDVSPVASPFQGLARVADAWADRGLEDDLNKAAAENATYNQSQVAPIMDALYGGITGTSSPVASALAAGADPAMGNPPDVSSNGSTFSPFIDTVKGSITNPYGLAAVASTGRAESGWSPVNASRSWADPSQSGDPGTAGGILSWRGPRLSALQAFAKANGETGNGSPETQAKFFLQEDPNLVASLNGAKSVQEAQSAINRAWAFAGYDKPGGESSRRLGYASAYLPQFQKTAQPNSAAAAIEAQAPAAYVDPTVSAPNYVPPVASSDASSPDPGFDSSRFGNAPISPAAPQIYSAQSDFAPPLPEPRSVSAPPKVASVQPVQVAQNMPQVPRALIAQSLAVMQDPRATTQTKSVAEALLKRQQTYTEAAQKQALKEQERQQEVVRRQGIAQQTGINPAYAQDEDIWKAAAGNVFAAPSTTTLGNSIIDNRTGKPIYQGEPQRQPLMNLGDGTVYDPNAPQDQRFIQAPSGNRGFRQATPEEIKAFGTNGQVGPDGKFYPITPPQGTSLSVDPQTGALSFNQGAGVKPLTEGQSKDSFFTTRMTAATPTIDKFESALLSPDQAAADYVPGGRYYQSEEYQLAKDAGRDFVTAFLRKDSGAAISSQEEKTYGELLLPQPGDKPAILAAKRQRRQIATEAIKSGMPPSAVDGVLKAIQAVPGANDPAKTTKEINGYKIKEVN